LLAKGFRDFSFFSGNEISSALSILKAADGGVALRPRQRRAMRQGHETRSGSQAIAPHYEETE
jgi:hypothetical protein